jgi:hypothetical protein
MQIKLKRPYIEVIRRVLVGQKKGPDDGENIGTKNQRCGARATIPCSVGNCAALIIPAQSPAARPTVVG